MVIGGGSGVGRGIALGLAAEEMAVVVADMELDSATRMSEEILAGGGSAIPVEVDTTDRGSLERLADTTLDEHGAVHILASTVGVILERRLDEVTDEDRAWMLKLNVMAQVRAVDVFLPLLRASEGPAHIVLTAAPAGLVEPPSARLGVYAATKRALVAYGEVLGREVEVDGIGVSLLCPNRVAGNLATTSRRSRRRRLGPSSGDPGGEPRTGPDLMPNEAIGPLVVEAIRAKRLYVFNRPAEIREPLEERYRRLVDDVRFWREWSEPINE